MTNPLISKLERFTRLSSDERVTLDALASRKLRRIRSREHLIHEGDRLTCVNLIVVGWAHSYKVLADGRRQIVAFLLPGDLCDPHGYILNESDHSIAAVTPLTVAQLSPDEFEALNSPRLVQALRWDALVTSAIQREWTVNIGQRSALERTAHLILELFHRLESIGPINAKGYDFPIRQTEMADALGMTAVHTNRMLQILRKEHLIDLGDKHLAIPDLSALERLAMFNPNYLHLQHEGHHLDAKD